MQQQPNGATGEETIQLRRYVQAALVAKSKGSNVTAYNNFVRELGGLRRRVEECQDGGTCVALRHLLHALTACVSLVRERKHEALMREVLSVNLWACPQDVRAAVTDLLLNLMVANSGYVNSCLQLLTQSVLPPPGSALDPGAACEPGVAWEPGPAAVEVQATVVAALQRALELIPTLPPTLLALLVQNMPHKTRDRHTQCLYLRAAFSLAESAAGAPLREGLLLGVVEHLLTVDVEIRWEAIVDQPTGQEEEEGDTEDEDDLDMFELEGMSELDINGIAANGHAPPAPPAQRGGWEGAARGGVPGLATAAAAGPLTVDEAADKLDSMMELVLGHLMRRCDAGQMGAVWATLLEALERAVLHTHRSKFTQFVLFYVARRDAERCCASLVRALLGRLRDARQPPITRAACAAYLASFLARAAFAPEALVVEVLGELVAACGAYAAGFEQLARSRSAPGALTLGDVAGANGGAAPGPAPLQHQVFYAMMQAALYLLCYHLEPLLTQHPQHPGSRPAHAAAVRALVGTQLVPLLRHAQLAPLGVCLVSVSTEFVKQAAALKLANLSDLLPAPATAAAAAGAAARPPVRPLEMFFPFDPYLLRRSGQLLDLEASYVRWRGGHPTIAAAGDGDAGGGLDDGATSDAGEGDDALAGASDSGDDATSTSGTSSDDDEDGGRSSLRDGSFNSRGGGAAVANGGLRSGWPRPVGVAAAAARTHALSHSSPSLVDPMASSLGVPAFLGGSSFSPANGTLPGVYSHSAHQSMGTSPFYDSSLGGGSTPPLGHSPMAMSITPWDSYMARVPDQLAK